MSKIIIILIITWILSGIISFWAVCIMDMRGQKYFEDYFKGEFGTFLLINFGGYISMLAVIIVFINNARITNKVRIVFTKLVYKIANIGIKEKEYDGE